MLQQANALMPERDAAVGQPLLTLRGVGKTFSNGVTALHNVEMTIREGDFLSLLGPSGCGKSTVLRLIAGLATPTAGQLVWQKALGDDCVGFVFQEPTLLPWASVFDNVWLPLRLRGVSRSEARKQVMELLERVHLTGFENAVPRELSGGMKMRVSIARGLVDQLQYDTRHIVNMGKVAPHPAMVKEPDRRPFHDRFGKQENRHIGPSPRPIDGKEPQAGHRKPVEMAVGMRDQLIGLLCGGVEADRMIGFVVHRKR